MKLKAKSMADGREVVGDYIKADGLSTFMVISKPSEKLFVLIDPCSIEELNDADQED